MSRIFLLSMLIVTIISIGLIGSLWTWQQYLTFQQEAEDLQEMMLNSYKDMLTIQVKKSVEYIEYRKSLTEERLRSSIQERVYEAHAMASHFCEKWKGQKSTQEIQTLIKESLRTIRFNQGRGYFFILNLDGIIQLQADRPESEGRDMLNEPDNNEVSVIHRDMIRLVTQQKEGFYQYDWTKPDVSEGTFSKIAFVKLFEPYNWIIGTGEYLNEFESNVKANVLNYLGTIRFGKDGYVFVAQWDGLDLTGPAKGRNMLDVTDVNGVRIVRELITLAKSGGGFLRYVMPKLKGLKPDPKLSYVQGIKDWEWYVGAGIYIDDIEKTVEAKQAEMTRKMLNSLAQITAILLGIIVFAYFFARRTSQNARASFDLFTRFFEKGARESAVIDPEAMTYEEFKKLAHSANDMIKARMQAQMALGESEKKYRLIVENLNDLIIKLDRNKNLIFASLSYCNLFEKPLDEILNQAFLPLGLEKDREMVQTSLNALDKPPHTSYHEERVLTKSGHRWLAWSSRAILDADGQPVEYVSVGRDITEKKQAEDNLRENQEWLQNILDSVQAGVVVIDPETHKIVELNLAAAEMIGTKKEQIINKICHNHICPNDIGMCPVTDLGLSIEQSDRELLKADGTRVPILKTVNKAILNGKEYLIESFLDLSDKKRLESMLLQAQKMESIGTLAGGIAHDFNNILFPIMGMSEMMMEDFPENSPEYEMAKQIFKASIRASDLVKQILAFSRQSEQKMIPVRIQQVLQEVINLSRSTIPSNIEIFSDIQNNCGLIMANPTQLHQIVMNLITNAYHAVELIAGKISVVLRETKLNRSDLTGSPLKPGQYALLSIFDNGCGIDKSIMDKIFEPYFTTKGKGKGTGLGLSVVYGIVKEHHGDIKIYSEIGKGTTANVFFPLIKGASEIESIEKIEKIQTGSERILLVDDEEPIVKLEKQMLERFGYNVTSRVNSLEAFEAFKAKPNTFDLVITDMTMPNMTGDQLAKKLISVRSDIPIIICTGFSERINKESGQAIGIKGFLMKPVVKSDMALMVRKVLDEAKIFNK